MNDVIATDGDTEAFLKKYAAVIESITKEMPSVRIYINSIFPVSASAAEKEPALAKIADYNTAFMDLEMGAVDAIAMDVIVAGYQMEQREDGDNYVILDETLAAEEYGIGFKKGNEELRDKVQTTLEEMAADGTMAEISNKWFGRDVTVIGK